MSALRQIPSKIFTLIFDHLSHDDLYQCLFVSHLWHDQAQVHVYSDVTLYTTRTQQHNQSLVSALKVRKHLLRKGGSDALEDDLLAIVLDYGPVITPVATVAIADVATDVATPAADSSDSQSNNNNTDKGSHPSRSLSRSFSRLASVFWSRPTRTTAAAAATATATITTIATTTAFATASAAADADPTSDLSIATWLIGPGPNRPALQHFIFIEDYLTGTLLETVLLNLMPTALTILEICIKHAEPDQSYEVDMEKILETYLYLKDICLDGLVFRYTPMRQLEDLAVSSASAFASVPVKAGCSKEPEVVVIQQHRLEAFTFGPNLLSQEVSDAFLFVRRLENLTRIRVRSTTVYAECAPRSRPWDFGRALKEYCPKLESIDIDGPVVFWLFDLPILPYDQLLHITSMVQENPAYLSDIPAELAQLLKEKRLKLQLLGQEQRELLEGKTAVPFFPMLKKLVLGGDHSLSVQDLFSLGVQARLLTHLEIFCPLTRHTEPWEVYEKDDKNVDSAPTTLRSSLKFLSLTGCSVTFERLVEGYIAASSFSGSTSAGGGVRTLYIRPWACEDTLETLKVGLDVPCDLPKEHHAALWRYLSRFKKLRHLSLVPTLKPCWVLVPTFDHGIEGLFYEGRMNETLEKLEMVTTWWDAVVGKEMVLWLAKSCPRLKDLDFKYHFLFSGFTTMDVRHRAFLEDEEVKQCSIRNIGVLSW
ncbi:hypothetical protein BGZ47_006642 [Haplosporangium gracile]|nr:hypothetical protein BGZ47_006642 [Haplosporangium gracile]